MKQRNHFNTDLTRRSWMVLATSALAGCGGGGSTTAGAPGTGGTGQYAVYSQGSISGFGSVIVNGVKYNDLLAVVQVNGVPATSADLRLGMIAAVQGELSVTSALGTAGRIDVWSIGQGLPAPLVLNVIDSFQVAGMTVQTDSATVLDGISSIASLLTTPQPVAVWGLQAGADGSHWTATRVAVVTDTTVVSTGLIQGTSSQKTLNGLGLSNVDVGSLTNGQLVRAKGTLNGTTLAVASGGIQSLSPVTGVHPAGEVEIEGVVTSTPTLSGFMLGNIQVAISSSTTYSPANAQITKDARIEVYGTWLGDTLNARKVEIENSQTLLEVEIEARIEKFTLLSNFVMRGQRCDATNARISNGTAADLKVGVKAHVKGTKAGDVLMVTTVELDI